MTDTTAAARQRAYKARLRADGRRQITVWVRDDDQARQIREYLDQGAALPVTAEPPARRTRRQPPDAKLLAEVERLRLEVARLTAELEAERERRRDLTERLAKAEEADAKPKRRNQSRRKR